MSSPTQVSIKDVAKHAGVSSATVSRVLAKKPHVREEVKNKVMDAVTALGYRPSRIAQRLRTQQSKIIGLIISDVRNPFFTALARAVEDIAYTHDYAVFLCNSDENPEKELFYAHQLMSETVAGIIIAPTQADNEACRAIVNANIPIIVLDRHINGAEVDSVLSDNREAAYKLVSTLIKQGHRSIAAILSDFKITTGQERYEGYIKALSEANIAIDEKMIFTGRPEEAEGYKLTQKILKLKKRPTALFTGTRVMTVGALSALYEHAIAIPQDMAVASFDKLEWMPWQPAISYAEQPTYIIGETAATLLLERIQTPSRPVQHVVLSSKIYNQGSYTYTPTRSIENNATVQKPVLLKK